MFTDAIHLTKEKAQEGLKKYQAYQKRYKGYPGSPGDSAVLDIYGYTVREERGYINRQVRYFKKALEWMASHNRENMTERECWYELL